VKEPSTLRRHRSSLRIDTDDEVFAATERILSSRPSVAWRHHGAFFIHLEGDRYIYHKPSEAACSTKEKLRQPRVSVVITHHNLIEGLFTS
jgi:hypothetical protein